MSSASIVYLVLNININKERYHNIFQKASEGYLVMFFIIYIFLTNLQYKQGQDLDHLHQLITFPKNLKNWSPEIGKRVRN